MNVGIRPGANLLDDGTCDFSVWAPYKKSVEVHVIDPVDRYIKLRKTAGEYFRARVEGISPGALYYLRINGELERPDPASKFQPAGVHGPSQVINTSYAWKDNGWQGLPLEQSIFYELHTGTFTQEGTFGAIKRQLKYLKDLGITVIELMPVAQFPGSRNWGYDGVYPYAAQNSYGGPAGLQSLVDACHAKGIAVILDVVYNHLGPEGNYLRDFGPYFTDQYRTPWGDALNFDGPDSDGVRNFFIQNALYWARDFHVDGLRLDAVHAISDSSPVNIIEELTQREHALGHKLKRKIHVIAESNANDVRLIRSRRAGGYAVDAVWNDDFHHSLHTLLTGEKSGYYIDFGRINDLKKACSEGFVYSGQYAPFWKRKRGSSSRNLLASKFVVCAQNHDQVGNRMLGERLSSLVSYEALKLAAGVSILSPSLPLLFMGEEYGETAPFLYFVDHSDEDLIEAVRTGRREEFASFKWNGKLPDPVSRVTYEKSKINISSARSGRSKQLLQYYHRLISLRRKVPALSNLNKKQMRITAGQPGDKMLIIDRRAGDSRCLMLFNFADQSAVVQLATDCAEWHLLIDSASCEWGGSGSDIKPNPDGSLQFEIEVQPLSAVVVGNRPCKL